MLITYRGRRSGNEYTTPVNYVEDGDTLLVVSSRDHDWWKTLRSGSSCAVTCHESASVALVLQAHLAAEHTVDDDEVDRGEHHTDAPPDQTDRLAVLGS